MGRPHLLFGAKNPLYRDPKLSPLLLKDQYALAPDPISLELLVGYRLGLTTDSPMSLVGA